jgi:hypothetical protein
LRKGRIWKVREFFIGPITDQDFGPLDKLSVGHWSHR